MHPLVAFTSVRIAQVLSIQFHTAALLHVAVSPYGKQIQTSFFDGLLTTKLRL